MVPSELEKLRKIDFQIYLGYIHILLILHVNYYIIVCNSDLLKTMLLQLLFKNVNLYTVHMRK